MKELSIVTPAYKEGQNLEVLLPQLNEVLGAIRLSYEIIIVDTMQPMDNTPSICDKYNARYVNRSGGNNYGDAVRTGIAAAEGKYVIFMDADGSHSPDFIPKLLDKRSEYDIIIASRYVKSGGSDNSLALILMSKMLNVSYSILLGIPCKDVSNSFKLYCGNSLKALKLSCNNFDIVEEIIFKICRDNRQIRILEIPYFFKVRLFGKTKRNLLLFILTYLATIVRLRFRK